MFLSFKKKDIPSSNKKSYDRKLSKSQINFLNEADYNYTMTFKTLDMKYFSKYASRELYMSIYYTLSVERPWIGISDKFKHTTWKLLEVDENNNFLVQKTTTFDKVKITKQLKLSVADDYSEYWVIVCINNKMVVEKIQSA